MFGKTRPGFTQWLLIGTLVILIVSVVVLSLVPPVSKDALVHHLAVPKLYLKHGGMYEIPLMPFSYYPMNLDLLFLIPLYLGNDIIPKFIHFCFALLTAWLIFSYLRRKLGNIYALFGALFFLSLPIIIKLSITAYVDLGVIFFTTASLLLLLKWIESGFRLRFLMASALMCGLALGAKYNALISLFLLTLFASFFYSRYAKGRKPGFFKSAAQGAVFFLVALLFFSPWMIRNYAWRSNPIYPLYDGWFNPSRSISERVLAGDALRSHPLDLFTYREVIYWERWWQLALLPIRVFFQGEDGSHQYFDGKLNPFLIFLPILAFCRAREDSDEIRIEKKILLSFAILYFGFTFFSSELRVRYISPVIPPLVILSVMGVKKIADWTDASSRKVLKQTGRAAVFVIPVLALVYNAQYLSEQFRYVKPLHYLGGKLSRDDYVSNYRPEHPVMRFINGHLPSNVRILFVFVGKTGYYCDRDYVVLGEEHMGRLISASDRAEEMAAGLGALGITHMLIRYDLFEKWIKNNFHGEDEKMIRDFFLKYVKILYYENGFGVSTLIESQN